MLEKYVAAAKSIVSRAVPTSSRVVAEHADRRARASTAPAAKEVDESAKGPLSLSYYEPATVSATFKAEHDGRYQLVLDLTANEQYVDGVFDYNKCRLIFKVDGEELLRREFGRQDGRTYRPEFDRDWKAGPHELTLELQPLTPGRRVRSLAIRINAGDRARADGREVLDPAARLRPVLPRRGPRGRPGAAPLRAGAARPVRRRGPSAGPWTRRWLDRLVGARRAGISAARAGPSRRAWRRRWPWSWRRRGSSSARRGSSRVPPTGIPCIDEYALASRLSYFLWSSMPDDELFRLAGEHKLRENLQAPGRADARRPALGEFFRHFVGQWLQARDVDSVLINASAVISRDQPPDPEADKRRARFRELNRKPPGEPDRARRRTSSRRSARPSSGRSAGSASSS